MAGSGDDSAADQVVLSVPSKVQAFRGTLFVAETGDCLLREIDLVTRIITTVAGLPYSCGYSLPGRALGAPFSPMGLWYDGFTGLLTVATVVFSYVRQLNCTPAASAAWP
jgi:hypothetical protein